MGETNMRNYGWARTYKLGRMFNIKFEWLIAKCTPLAYIYVSDEVKKDVYMKLD